MENKMYLIHEDDYIKHIDEKVFLYSLVKQLTHHVARLAPNRGSKKISNMAKCYDAAADKLFRSWGIPVSYLVFGNKDDLSELMENELITPEDAGYIPAEEVCDDECCYDCCGCEGCPYADSENDEDVEGEADDGDEFIEMIAAMFSAIHKIFVDKVSVYIIVEV